MDLLPPPTNSVSSLHKAPAAPVSMEQHQAPSMLVSTNQHTSEQQVTTGDVSEQLADDAVSAVGDAAEPVSGEEKPEEDQDNCADSTESTGSGSEMEEEEPSPGTITCHLTIPN